MINQLKREQSGNNCFDSCVSGIRVRIHSYTLMCEAVCVCECVYMLGYICTMAQSEGQITQTSSVPTKA